MEKNYYEILEIDKNASNEIIEKAYKTLAKKYHPDLQEEGKKASAEEHMKKINEAYAVLSDETMRIEYDESLENENITKEEYSKILQENSYLKARIEQLNRNINNKSNNVENTYDTNEYKGNQQQQNQYYQQPNNQYQPNQYYQQQENIPENLAEYYINKMNQSIQQAYQDAYIQDMKNRGYRFKTKHTIKDYLKMIATIAITIIIVILVFQIPFVKKYFISVYQDNYFVKIIVDIFVNTFKQMFKM